VSSKTYGQYLTNDLSRRLVLAAGVSFLVAGRAAAGQPHILVMVEEAGCIYCQRWHAEVGGAYAKSAEGRFAPLKRVTIGAPELSHLSGLRYTPTFVLMQEDREIGRITGYPGAEFFWSLLGELLSKTSFAAPTTDEIKT
jgi:thioredoxin-related protein